MIDSHSTTFIDWLAKRLTQPLPGWRAQSPFQPELSFGRHFTPPPVTARQAAVLLLLYPGEAGWTIPLTLRPVDMLDHAGQISFPGGTIDPGERSEDAARRELKEELGVLPRDLTMLGQLSPIYLFNSNFAVTPWLAATAARPDWTPNVTEVAELIEAPLRDLRRSTARVTFQRQVYGINSTIPAIEFRSHRIWGGTCMILGELLALLDEADRAGYTDHGGN